MIMKVTEREPGTVVFEESFPDEFRSDTGVSIRDNHLQHRLSEVRMQETWFEGVLINHGEVKVLKSMDVTVETDASVVEMHFSLSGSTKIKMENNTPLPETFKASEHNIMYTPAFNGAFKVDPSPIPYQFFEIHLTESFFKKLVNEENTVLAALANKMDRKEIAVMSQHNMGITSRMNSIIADIRRCERKGTLQRIFLESKVLELLLLQAEQFEDTLRHNKQQKFRLKTDDVDRLHYTKWLLEQNPGEDYSLAALAKTTGLNEYKLKKGFRELWDTSVFRYLHELRMEHARRILLDEHKTVGEAADYAGYRNAHHFTAAFKKYFGYLPREVKQA